MITIGSTVLINSELREKDLWKKQQNFKRRIKKSHGHIHAEIEDKFKFIEENKGTYDIKRLCKALKISRSEYYYHKNHRINVYKEDNRKLDVDILRAFNESKKRYGSPKIQQMLEKEGKHVSIKRIGKRMRLKKIKLCIVKKYRPANNNKKVNILIYFTSLTNIQ